MREEKAGAATGGEIGIFVKRALCKPNLATFRRKNGDQEQSGSVMSKVQRSKDWQNSALAELQAVLSGTPVLTLDGEMPVEYLQPGDRVLTRAGMRRLTELRVNLVQNARMVCISHETLGVDRPSEDLLVSAGQMVLVRDWRARALAGVPAALFPASRLVDGEYIRSQTLPEARLYTLVFEEEAIIYAGGLELVCPALVEA